MNDLEILRELVLTEFPRAVAQIDEPRDMQGIWFLDISFEEPKKKIAVEWSPKKEQFGVYKHIADPNEVSPSDPDEVYENLSSTLSALRDLLRQEVSS